VLAASTKKQRILEGDKWLCEKKKKKEQQLTLTKKKEKKKEQKLDANSAVLLS
jgi:hypothetical protein